MEAAGALSLPEALILFVVALIIGGYGTIVGAGGGFLIVPILLVVFRLPPALAAGTSLLTVFCSSVSGAYTYARQRRVDFTSGIRFALVAIPGSIAGAFFANWFSGPVFKTVFGLLLILLAAFLAFRPRAAPALGPDLSHERKSRWRVRRVVEDRSGRRFVYSYHEPAALALSFLLGFMSSTLGIGGGFIYVPALVYLFNFPPHVATATSLFILVISTGAGSLSHLLNGNILFSYGVVLSAGVVIGAQVGARLANRIHGIWIVRLLALALALTGLRLLFDQLGQ